MPASMLRHAREIGFKAGLRHVYEGNVPDEGGENTYCYACNALLIARYGFMILGNGRSVTVSAPIDGVEMDGAPPAGREEGGW